MGSRSECPPLPLFWAEDRKVPERKVTARPRIKKATVYIMETEKPLFRVDLLSVCKEMGPAAPHPHRQHVPPYLPEKEKRSLVTENPNRVPSTHANYPRTPERSP